jgi:hypothetical protein
MSNEIEELFENSSLIEIEKYIFNIEIAYSEFKQSLFSEEVSDDRVRHLIDKSKFSIREFIPNEIIWDCRTNRFEEDRYIFYCRDKKILDDFIEQVMKDSNDEYDDLFNYYLSK